MKKIIILASINMDIVSRVTTHPAAGETVKGEDFCYIPGGKGANQAIAAHRLGGNLDVIGKIGNDSFGDTLLRFYEGEGIRTEKIVKTKETPTGAAFVAVDAQSENLIYVSGGANNQLSTADTDGVEVQKDDLVVATLETPHTVTKDFFARAKDVGAHTVLNAAPAVEEAQTLFPLCDYLIVNESELAAFTKSPISDTEDGVIAYMRQLVGPRNIITTLGRKGIVAFIGNEPVIVPGREVQAVDTTGAGDCFVGAFVAALQEGKDVRAALSFGNAAAAVSVQRVGASSSMPTWDEVDTMGI